MEALHDALRETSEASEARADLAAAEEERTLAVYWEAQRQERKEKEAEEEARQVSGSQAAAEAGEEGEKPASPEPPSADPDGGLAALEVPVELSLNGQNLRSANVHWRPLPPMLRDTSRASPEHLGGIP